MDSHNMADHNTDAKKFWIKCRNKYLKYTTELKHKNRKSLGARNAAET